MDEHTTRTAARSARGGFTLIELIAVIAILAILAGVAIPKYFDYSAEARRASVQGTLGGVRSGVANFFANQAVNGTARYPTYTELTTVGTVMQEPLPANPYNNDNTVRDADGTWVEGDPPISGSEGWAYDSTNGKFWANSDVVNENQF